MFPLAGCGFWGSRLCCLAMVTIRLELDLGPKAASAKVVLTCQSCNLPYPQRSPPFRGGGERSAEANRAKDVARGRPVVPFELLDPAHLEA